MTRDERPFQVDVVVPARNDEATLPAVLGQLPRRLFRSVVVVDNASSDRTARVAEDSGAVLVRESKIGLGAACLRGIAHLSTLPEPPDAVVFCPADGTVEPADLAALVEPLREHLFDLVIGSRTLGEDVPRARILAENFVPLRLIRTIYGHRYSDIGPLRAIRYPALVALGLRDADYGWLVEMQVKALRVGLRVAEVPVRYRTPRGKMPLREQVKWKLGKGTKTLFQILRHSTAR